MPTSVAQALRLAALALGAFAVLAAKPSTEMSAQQPKQAAAVGVGGVSTGCQKRMTAVCGDWEANKGVCAEPARGRGDGSGAHQLSLAYALARVRRKSPTQTAHRTCVVRSSVPELRKGPYCGVESLAGPPGAALDPSLLALPPGHAACHTGPQKMLVMNDAAGSSSDSSPCQ